MNSAPLLLTVVMPAYNEETLLAATAGDVRTALTTLGVSHELVIINDGSRDRTGEIADDLVRRHAGVRAFHQANQGLGGALRAGFARANGEYILCWPADTPVSAEDLAPFIAALGRADVLVGYRSRRAGYSAVMRLNSWLYPRLIALLFGLRLRDVNWVHLYRTRLIRDVPFTQKGIPMLAEALVRLRDVGATFVEVPSEMKPRTAGVASASRPVVMWRTLVSLLSFWRQWRRTRRLSPQTIL